MNVQSRSQRPTPAAEFYRRALLLHLIGHIFTRKPRTASMRRLLSIQLHFIPSLNPEPSAVSGNIPHRLSLLRHGTRAPHGEALWRMVRFMQITNLKNKKGYLVAKCSKTYMYKLTSYNAHLFSNSCAELNLHTSARQNMYPKPLGITQAVILALDFCKLDLSLFDVCALAFCLFVDFPEE